MIRTQVYLTEKHVERLNKLKIQGIDKSEVMRKALDDKFDRDDNKKYRVIEENKKTGVRTPGSWLKNKDKAEQMINGLGKKKPNTIYYIEQEI